MWVWWYADCDVGLELYSFCQAQVYFLEILKNICMCHPEEYELVRLEKFNKGSLFINGDIQLCAKENSSMSRKSTFWVFYCRNITPFLKKP